MMEMDPGELAYVSRSSGLGGAEFRVRIEIDRTFDPPIPRAEFTVHPVLRSLRIIAQPQGTNFAVQDAEAQALEGFLTGDRGSAAVHDPGTPNVPWDPRMRLVGYFLSRCGTAVGDQPADPPDQLGVASWGQAFDLFYPVLGGGRTRTVFRNSLKGIRDTYDGHIPESGRVGWRHPDESVNRVPIPLTGAALAVFRINSERSCDELWAEVEPLVTLPRPLSFDQSWADLVRWLLEHRRWSSLVHERGYELESVDGDRILYRRLDTGKGDEMSRAELIGMWQRIRESPGGFHPTTSSRSATLALLPNIEYATNPLLLFWVDPASHALGSPTRHGADRGETGPITLAAVADSLYLDAGYVGGVVRGRRRARADHPVPSLLRL